MLLRSLLLIVLVFLIGGVGSVIAGEGEKEVRKSEKREGESSKASLNEKEAKAGKEVKKWQAKPLPESYKQVTIGVAISQLNREAREGWKKNKTWPRATPSFAHALSSVEHMAVTLA